MKNLACPVCGKSLTQDEYDKALGLWQEKHEHIKHLEAERKKLKQQEGELKKEQARLRKEAANEKKKLWLEAKVQARQFANQRSAWKRDTRQLLVEQTRKSDMKLKEQRVQMEIDFKLRGLVQHKLEQRSRVTLEAKPFIVIEGLDQKKKLLGDGKSGRS